MRHRPPDVSGLRASRCDRTPPRSEWPIWQIHSAAAPADHGYVDRANPATFPIQHVRTECIDIVGYTKYLYIMKCAAGLLLVASLVVVTAAVAAALGNGLVGYPAGERFYSWLFSICHQYPTRSFWIMGNPLGICARCFGGYTGVIIASICILLYHAKINSTLILVALLLAVVGVGDALLRVYAGVDRPNLARAVTGLMGGIGLATIVCVTFNVGWTKCYKTLSSVR